ncbi:MAG TPA: prolyl oligopeptidase family serine peptidase [Thermoanaerobaculia bacterium]|nr:prolyl oligopeptidase family serine peptidase [Thermoanaerobaculia bacterium]
MNHQPGRIVILLSCLFLVFAQTSAAAPAPDFLSALLSQGLAGLSFSPDGSKILVSMNGGGLYNAFAVPAAGGPPVQLTRSAQAPVFVETYFPHDERFLFRSRKAEGEPEHLFVRELDGRETDLSPGKGSRFKGWNADGTSFLIDEDHRGSGVDNVYEVSTQAGYARKFFFQNTPKSPFAFASPDRRFLVTTRVPFDLSREIYIKDTRTDQVRGLFSGEAQAIHLPVDFTPDGTHFLELFDGGAKEFLYLARVDIATGIIKGLVYRDWDVLAGTYSPDHKLIALTVAGDASSHLELYDTTSFQRVALPDVPLDGLVNSVAFSPDSKTLAFIQSSSDSPPEILAIDLAQPGPPRKLIQGGRPDVLAGSLVAGKLVRFTSYDKTEIPGILFQPKGAGPEHKTPAVIWVHDGPSQQTRLGFDPFFQYLLSRGNAVYAINHRGSSGYGKSFQRLDNGHHGDIDLRDCLAAKAMLEATGWIDPKRIAIAGEGHGGFLALAALSLHPQELSAGISFSGLLDWGRYVSNLRQSDPRRGLLYEELGDLSNDEFWQRVSPAFHASAVVHPVLLVQGANDTIAIPQEAQAFVAAVKAKGVPAEEVLLPGEGHEFSSTASLGTAYRAAADFLDRNLKPEAPPKAGKKK